MRREGIPHQLRADVMQRDKYKCVYCGSNAECLDHVLPYSHGGIHEYENLVACCKKCNRAAGAKVFQSLHEKKLFILTMHVLNWQSIDRRQRAASILRRELKKMSSNPLYVEVAKVLVSRYSY